MDLEDLLKKIGEFKIPERWYSIDEGLKPDACILYKNYSVWEYFYLSERGERSDLVFFTCEKEAYDHLWSKLEQQLAIFDFYNTDNK